MQISIIMSVYNGSRYLRESIESILNQTYRDFEFIIFDDASTDDSASIIESYNDPRIVFIKNDKNYGLTLNLINGVQLAKGKYIARIDSDDVAFDKRLERQIDYMETHTDIDVCGSLANAIDSNGRKRYIIRVPVNDKEIKENLIFGNCIIHPSVMMRKSLFEKHQYDASFRTCQDYNLWSECICDCTFANLNEVLLGYRVNFDGISRSERKSPDKRYATLKTIYERNIGRRFNCLDDKEVTILSRVVSELFTFQDKNEAKNAKIIIKKTTDGDVTSNEKRRLLLSYYRNSPHKLEFINSYFLRGAINSIVTKLKLLV